MISRKALFKSIALSLLASSLAAAEPVQRALGVVYLQETSRTVDLEMHRPKLEVLQLQPPIQREYLAIGGSRSPVRRSVGAALKFASRFRLFSSPNGYPPSVWNTAVIDPSQYRLYQLRQEENRRLLVFSETTPIKTVYDSGLALKLSSLDPDTILLEPGEPLAAGEYAIISGREPHGCNVFCFGLDASPSSP